MRNLRVTYIESISNYVYRNGFDKVCERDLKRKGVGAFAFYQLDQPEDLWNLNDKAHRKALAKTGDWGYASAVQDRAQTVGFAMVVYGGEIIHRQVSCRKLRHAGKTTDALLEYLVKKGFRIDPKKLCDPVEMYRPVLWV